MKKLKNHWENYFSNVNDSLASIFVDLEYVYHSPNEIFPQLAWLWIKMKNPREDGLSSENDFDSLCTYEDNLSKFIKNNLNGHYVGRVTTLGRREFYFYLSNEVNYKEKITEFLQKNQNHLTQFNSKQDPLWDHYSNFLYPGANGLEQIKKKST